MIDLVILGDPEASKGECRHQVGCNHYEARVVPYIDTSWDCNLPYTEVRQRCVRCGRVRAKHIEGHWTQDDLEPRTRQGSNVVA